LVVFKRFEGFIGEGGSSRDLFYSGIGGGGVNSTYFDFFLAFN
jgi:hypothetical protein